MTRFSLSVEKRNLNRRNVSEAAVLLPDALHALNPTNHKGDDLPTLQVECVTEPGLKKMCLRANNH